LNEFRLPRDVNGARGFAVEQRVRKTDDVGFRGGEDGAECGEEIIVRRVVGPQREDTAGMQLRGEATETVGLIKRAVPRVEEILW